MAFTSDTEADDDVPYDLKIYFAEYDDNDFFGIASLPKSDRGYAKNEIVAAVVELDIPDGEDITDNYTLLDISGDNVDFKVTDAPIYSADTKALVLHSNGSDGWDVSTSAMGDDVTYKWLVFAKVTDDDASITAKLVDGDGVGDFSAGTLDITLEGEDYTITSSAAGYVIEVTSGDYDGALIKIDVDDDNVSEGMSIDPHCRHHCYGLHLPWREHQERTGHREECYR